jgi:guanylate kinase
MRAHPETPLLLIISAPSGAGKTTLCHKLLERSEAMAYSVSCTTREPRGEEKDGEAYYFLDEPAFRQKIEEDAFLEYARVHGAWYGTLRATVEHALRSGRDVLMDIDVQGAAQIREAARHAEPDSPIRRGYVDVFIEPPSMDELKRRLTGRGEDAEDVVARRLKRARQEMEARNQYAYRVVNECVDESVDVLAAIVTAEHHRVRGGETGGR